MTVVWQARDDLQLVSLTVGPGDQRGKPTWKRERTMNSAAFKGLVVANLFVGFNLSGWAQETDIGKLEYQTSCAMCHGIDGKGTGPLAGELKTKPSDLTAIAKGNNGVFPFNRVYETIDGRQAVKSHGSREMPIWGFRYNPSPIQGFNRSAPYYVDPLIDREGAIRGRILALVEYVYRIQAK
jgi:mono/diheme cytochrome c family protein